MQTIRQRAILSRAAVNSPRAVRVSNHRDPQWIEGPHKGDSAVGVVLAAIVGGLIVLALLGERYGIDLIAGAM